MIIYAENPISSAKAIKLICDFIKVALYNSNLFLKIHYFCVFSVAKLYPTLWDTMDWHTRVPCPSQSLPKFLSIKSVMLSSHLILCHSLLLLPSVFPSIRVFSNKLALCIGGQSIGASVSASVLPMSIQDCFLLGLTGLIFLLSRRLSRVFSSTTVQKHQFFSILPSLWSNSNIHTWLL